MTTEWIKTDAVRLQNSRDLFEAYLQEFQAGKQQMIARMDELNMTWRGPAKEAFLQQFQTDCELLTEVYEKLREMSEAMQFAASEYRSCDSRIDSIVTGIRI